MMLALLFSCFFYTYSYRSIHRPHDKNMPTLIVRWPNSTQEYTLRDWHLEYSAIFEKFDNDFFFSHQLPLDKIPFRINSMEAVSGTLLDNLINELIDEIMLQSGRPNKFSHFIILKDSDFNYKTHSGLIVVRFKDYPFVVKLFIESPSTFVQPFSKGFEPSCIFIMGGGINRYLSGFTRIKNLEAIKLHIQNDPYWSERIDLPRKWYWQPLHNQWFELIGLDIGQNAFNKIKLPAIYGIVSDFIDSDRELRLLNKKNRRLAMQLSQFLGNRIDPHIYNFMIEKNTQMIVIVDTEHFPSMVGLRSTMYFSSYCSWYCQLMIKFMCDSLFRSKKKRRAIQYAIEPRILSV